MSKEVLFNNKKHNIDKEKLKRLLPKGTNHKVTDEIIDIIGSMEKDIELDQGYLEESLLSHLPVLKEIKVDLKDYINAIKFCNLKKSMSNEKAWEITFPEKYKKLREEGRKISSHVSMYNLSKIVTKIDAQMMVAAHIQYAPMFHESIMAQYNLMKGIDANGVAVSPTVQHLAAKTLAELTAPPVEQKVDIKIGQSNEARASQERMLEELSKVAKAQQELLKSGYSIEEIQKLNLTIENPSEEDEYIEVEDEI
jgi:hypothetical protein